MGPDYLALLQFFLNHVEFGMDLQEAIDAPTVHTSHFRNSFYPRGARPGVMAAEGRISEAVRKERVETFCWEDLLDTTCPCCRSMMDAGTFVAFDGNMVIGLDPWPDCGVEPVHPRTPDAN